LKGDNVTSNIFEELRWRGLIYDSTEGVEALVTKEKVTLYNVLSYSSLLLRDAMMVGRVKE
jgi:hypothetical protein